jgi:hypothetical protein
MSPSPPDRTDPADRRQAAEQQLERLIEAALASGPPEPMTDADWTVLHGALDAARSGDKLSQRWRTYD